MDINMDDHNKYQAYVDPQFYPIQRKHLKLLFLFKMRSIHLSCAIMVYFQTPNYITLHDLANFAYLFNCFKITAHCADTGSHAIFCFNFTTDSANDDVFFIMRQIHSSMLEYQGH